MFEEGAIDYSVQLLGVAGDANEDDFALQGTYFATRTTAVLVRDHMDQSLAC